MEGRKQGREGEREIRWKRRREQTRKEERKEGWGNEPPNVSQWIMRSKK